MEEEKNRVEEPVQQEITLTEASKSVLITSAKWSKFLAIVNFIACGIILIIGIAALFGSSFAGAGGFGSYYVASIGWTYVVLGILLFFPAYYLYDFARKTLEAIPAADASVLEDALYRMKSYWKFNGILTIVVLSLSVLSCIFFIVADACELL